MGTSTNKQYAIALPFASYSIIDPDGRKSEYEVNWGTHYNKSWYDGGRKNELFHVGGGNPNLTEAVFGYDYGSYVLTPNNDFLAWVHMWGAGGGAYNSGNDSTRAGGGGFTQALVKFVAGIPYTLVIGEAGNYGGGRTGHGGGGSNANHTNTGRGGGLSGIFMNVTHHGRSPWAHNSPVKQNQALVIAGGGGGAGHHSQNANYGAGGGGGGWSGRGAHNSGAGGQNGGGHGSYYSASTHCQGEALHGGHQSYQGTWTGAGGSGWWGGGGGGHSGAHHNGGSGGSGHYAQPYEIAGQQPNNDKAQYILCGNSEVASGAQSTSWRYPGNFKNPLAWRSSTFANSESGDFAGRGGYGNSSPTAASGSSAALHGKIVLTLAPDILGEWSTKFNAQPMSTIWTVDSEYY